MCKTYQTKSFAKKERRTPNTKLASEPQQGATHHVRIVYSKCQFNSTGWCSLDTYSCLYVNRCLCCAVISECLSRMMVLSADRCSYVNVYMWWCDGVMVCRCVCVCVCVCRCMSVCRCVCWCYDLQLPCMCVLLLRLTEEEWTSRWV